MRTDIERVDAAPTDFPTPFEESNELWIVEGGIAKPTVRLADGPYESGWPTLPSNDHFSKDDKHLYRTNSDSEGRPPAAQALIS